MLNSQYKLVNNYYIFHKGAILFTVTLMYLFLQSINYCLLFSEIFEFKDVLSLLQSSIKIKLHTFPILHVFTK